ncbi:fumarylacetoacetate hydrolase family protein [Actinomycetospora sp. NBRC 106375]|uniref:fumarylacetoacetate hydrolase family protein n=1 Tax=Actinomycetospora sp. NBRC 106375 TaxID=3032207 RepID=UPI002555C192|nr:fumarylacetoacetate hydrolase family protein [Actinomycetospora sp. NBRC 106375]
MREAEWALVTHHQGDVAKAEVGVLAGGVVRRAPDELAGRSMLEVLGEWGTLAPLLRGLDPGGLAPVEGAVVLAPLRYPPKVLCAGANYYAHLAEMGVPRPSGPVAPYFFFKPPTTSVIGPDEAIVLPRRAGRKIDWEVELGAVIGRRCVDVPVERALDVVAGWTVVNDVSARDLLDRADPVAPPFGHDWVGAKAGDTFCPLGPGIVPSWLVDDPQAVALRLTVNGVVKQDSTAADMVTPIAELIAGASRAVTLEPGDVIATGTPAGVGFPRGDFLAPGDEVVAEIEGVGALRNPVTEREDRS